MSQVIDSKIVEMKFDNSDFESNVKESMSTLDKLKKDLNMSESAESFKEISKAAKDVSFDGLTSGIESVKTHFSAMEVIATSALWNITQKAVDAGLAMAKSLTIDLTQAGWNQYEEKTKSVQTIMNATGESIETVDSYLNKLLWFTDETSYSFQDMTNNIGKFTSMGIGLDDSTSAMMGISNWAAVSGAGINEASRAMYNLSQAMGIGSVRLMDWRSIENANMATKEFKEQVIDTAKAMGTLTDDSVNASNFSSTLSKGWFTSDVLLKVLKDYAKYSDLVYEKVQETGMACSAAMEEVSKYGDSFSDVAEKAFKAAQEAKTFTDAVEAVKDAVKSQWSQLFENVFGNYEEAKETWTGLANSLWEVFAGPIADFNEAFDEALESPSMDFSDWIKFRDQIKAQLGLSNEEFKTFEAALKHTAEQNGVNVDAMIEKWGSFAASIQNEGWLTAEILRKTLESTEGGATPEDALSQVQEIVNGIWNGEYGNLDTGRKEAIEALGFNYEEIQKLVDKGYGVTLTVDDLTESMLAAAGASGETATLIQQINEAIESGNMDTYKEFMAQMSGADLRNAFWSNLFNDEDGAIVTYFGAFKEAFASVFGSFESGGIRNILERLYEWSVKLLDPERVERFKTRLQNIFHVIHTIWNVLKGVWSVVKTIFDNTLGPVLKGLIKIIMAVADGIGSLFAEFDKATSGTNAFATAVAWINDKLGPVKRGIEAVAEGIAKFISKLFEGKDVFEALKEAGEWVIAKLFGPTYKGNGFTNRFKAFVDRLKSLKDTVVEVFKTIGNTFTKIWNTFENTKLFESISGFIQKIRTALTNLWNSITNWFTEKFGGGKTEDFSVLTSIQDALTNFNDWLSGIDFETPIKNVSDALVGFKDRVKSAFQKIGDFFEKNGTFQSIIGSIRNGFNKFTGLFKPKAEDDHADPKDVVQKSFFVRIWEAIVDVFGKIKEKLPTVLDWLVKGGGLVLLITIFRTVRKLFSGGGGLLRNVNKVLKGASRALSGFGFKQFGEGFKSIALSVAVVLGVVTGALIALTYVDQTKLRSVAEVMFIVSVGLSVLFGTIMTVMTKYSQSKALSNGQETVSKGLNNFLEEAGNSLGTLAKGAADMMRYKGLAYLIVSLAAALGVMAVAVWKLSELDTGRLIKGLSAVVVLVGVLVAAMKILTKGNTSSFGMELSKSGFSLKNNTVGKAASGFAFIGMAVAVLIFVQVIDQIAQYDLEDLLKGVVVIGAILLELSVSMRIAGKGFKLSSGLGAIAMAGSLFLFVKVIDKLKGFDYNELFKGIVTIGAILIELGIASRLAGSMKFTKGAGMFLVAEAVLVLTQAMKEVADLSYTEIMKGVAAITALMVALGIGGILFSAANAISDISGTLKGLGLILIGVAASIWAISDAISKGVDLSDVGAGLGELATGLVKGIVDAITNSADAIIGGIINLLGTLVNYAPQIVNLLVDFFISVIDALTVRLPELANSIASFCGALIDSFGEAFKNVDMSGLKEAIETLLITTGALALIGKFGGFGAILKGIGMFTMVIVAVGGLMTLLGGLNELIGTDKNGNSSLVNVLNDGVEILKAIGDGIGKFLGGLVGSFVGASMESFTASLPTVGTNLSDFMTAVQPFLDSCDGIDASFPEAVGYLTQGMLAIVGGSFLDTLAEGFSKFLFGSDTDMIGGYMEDFGAVADGLVAFNDKVKDVEWADSKSVMDAASIITALITIFPEEGGILQDITGYKNLAEASVYFGSLGQGVKSFCSAIGKDVSFDADYATKATACISALIENYPETGGTLQDFLGYKDLAKAGINFASLGLGIKMFVNSIGHDVSFDSANTELAIECINALIENYPETGGTLQDFLGYKDLASAGINFRALGFGVREFVNAIGTDASFDSANAESAAGIIATLIEAYPTSGGTWQEFAGYKDLANADINFTALGTGVKNFMSAIGADAKFSVETAQSAVDIICMLIENTPATGGFWQDIAGEKQLDNLAVNLAMLGTGISLFVAKTKDITSIQVSNAKIASQGIIDILGLSWPTGDNGVVGEFNAFIGTNVNWTATNTKIENLGVTLSKFVDSVKDIKATDITNAKTASEGIIEILNLNWPAQDGIFTDAFEFLFGTNNDGPDWNSLKQKLPEMGAAITAFAESVKGIPTTASMNASIAIGAIKTLLEAMPEDATGFDSVAQFNTLIAEMGPALNGFVLNMAELDFMVVYSASASIKSLIGALTSMADVDFENASAFSTALGTLASSGITEFTDAFDDSLETVTTSVDTFVGDVATAMSVPDSFETSGKADTAAFVKGLNSYNAQIPTLMALLVNSVVTALYKEAAFKQSGQGDFSAFYSGLTGSVTQLNMVLSTLSSSIAGAFSNYNAFYSSGWYCVVGLNNGFVEAANSFLYKNVGAVARSMKASFDAESGIQSPSKEFRWSALQCILGLVGGITDYGYMAEDSMADMANDSIDTVKSILSNMNFNDLDNAPVIRPVLDLSNIQNGASMIDEMLYADNSIGIDPVQASRMADSISRLGTSGTGFNPGYDDTSMIAVVNDLGTRIDNLQTAINNMKIYLNGKDVVGGIVYDMDDALGNLSTMKNKGVL